jgi:hypothetical protein
LVDIADARELRSAFAGEHRVNARVLFAEMANADDSGSKHIEKAIRGQRSDVSNNPATVDLK